MIVRTVLIAALSLTPLTAGPAAAQDVPGIEICTAEKTMERRTSEFPHRIRYLRLLNNLHRRTLDTQRRWLDDVERELSTPTHQHPPDLADT